MTTQPADPNETTQWMNKYRPKSLETYLASPRIITQCKSIISKRNVHAALLTGHAGIGKTTLARILAYELAGIPYGTQCPDIIEENMSAERGINDVRNLIATSKFLPIIGKRKVYILDEVHGLSGQAASALLKPLEEPSPHVVWLLCTNSPEKLLDTYIQRAIPLTLEPPSEEALAKRLVTIMLKEKAFISDGKVGRSKLAHAIVKSTSAIPRMAIQLLQTAWDSRSEYANITELIRGPVLRTPTAEVDAAALKVLFCLLRIQQNRKAALVNVLLKTLTEVDNILLLNRLIWLISAVTKEVGSDRPQVGAYQFIKVAREKNLKLNLPELARVLAVIVSTKQNVGDFAVDPGVLLLDAILRFVEPYMTGTSDEEEE